MSYDKWKARIRGEKVETFLQPDHLDEGYYRVPIIEGRTPQGRANVTGWVPVAYWLEEHGTESKLVGSIGERAMTDKELGDEGRWSYAVQNPISYETFCAVAYEGKPWPSVARTENQTADPDHKEPETVEEHRAAIKLIVDTVKDMKIDNEESAAIWLGTKNTLATLRLAADKAGQAIYKPHYTAYKKAFDAWTPMVKASEQAEKRIETAYKQFQNERRLAAEAEQRAAEQARREEEERNQRAADRAIARGEEPPEPEVEEAAPPPAAPAPVAPTVGTRSPKLELQTFLDQITDEAAVCAFFRGDPDLVAVLKTLAGRAIKKGQTVPGTTTREGYV